MNKNTLHHVAQQWIPPKLLGLLTAYRWGYLPLAYRYRDLIAQNQALHNKHAGQRCFILANGPSINHQDLSSLKNEIVFSVSNGYLHPDFKELSPAYHCVPQITYTKKMTKQVACDWFEEMHANLGDATLFLDLQERSLVQDHDLFNGRNLHHIASGKSAFRGSAIPAIDGLIPRSQSVPVMAIMIALYMDFKEIYLLGVDHDWFVKKDYQYAFDLTVLKEKDGGVGPNRTIETKLYDDLPMVEKLWGQYRALAGIARAHGVSIYNATAGGILDEFERISLKKIK